MIQTDNAEYDQQVGQNVRAAFDEAGLSVNGASRESGIPYTSLDRKLKGLSSFTVAELRRLGAITGRRLGDFLPRAAA